MKGTAKVKGAGGKVTAELVYGYASLGDYIVAFYDKTDKKYFEQTGISDDDVKDSFEIPHAASAIAGHLIYAKARATSMKPPDLVGVTLKLVQDGQQIGEFKPEPATVNPGQEATFVIAVRIEVA